MAARMRVLLTSVIVALCVIVGGGPAFAGFDPAYLSTQLDDGMTMPQVRQALGYRPNSAEQLTCGTQVGPGWECRIWTFTDSVHGLGIRFEKVDGAWVVNSWYVW